MGPHHAYRRSPDSEKAKLKFDPRLSGLRGLAAMSVLTVHLWSGKVMFVPFPWLASLWMGVPVFLMLSMFLLLRVLDDAPSIAHYIRRRVLRIWPTYFLFIAAAVAVDAIVLKPTFTWTDIALSATFTQYFAYVLGYAGTLSGGLGEPVGPLWTLQLEEFVYLLIPLIHKWGKRPVVGWAMVLFGLGWVTVSAALFLGGRIDQAFWERMWYAPPTWTLAYGLGLLAYLNRLPHVPRPSLFILASFIAYPFLQGFAHGVLSLVVFYPAVAFSVARFLVEPPALLARFTPIGEVSYGLYASQGVAYSVFGGLGFLVAPFLAMAVELPQRSYQILARVEFARTFPRRNRRKW